MDKKDLFCILDSLKADPDELLEYVVRVCKNTSLFVVFKDGSGYHVTTSLSEDRELVGIKIGDIVLFTKSFDSCKCSSTLSVKDIREFAKRIHPEAKPLSTRQFPTLYNFKNDYNQTAKYLRIYGYDAKPLPLTVKPIESDYTDGIEYSDDYQLDGTCVGSSHIDNFSKNNVFLYYCEYNKL